MKEFLQPGMVGSSFTELLVRCDPGLLPRFVSQAGEAPGSQAGAAGASGGLTETPRGTTILALQYRDGVLMAGDRQATEGFQVAYRRIEKVSRADDHSAIAIAGAAGPCLEMAKLFQTELAHYEKLEGVGLSLEGKANKLAQMIRMNLPAALQGLVVIPIFAGYDPRTRVGKIFKYDVTGGRYEETDFYATGSGGKDARSTLKRYFRPGLDEGEAVRAACEALIDAADEDVGTAGPDFVRGIFPTLKLVRADGITDVPDGRVGDVCRQILEARRGAA
jgi:proteasome beta subunit